MSLEAVKKEILASVREQAEQRKKETAQQAKEILAKADEEIKQQEEETRQKTKVLLAAMEQQESSLARSEAKRILLDMQKAVLDELMEQLKEILSKLPQKKRDEYCTRLLKKAQAQLSVKWAYTSKQDKKAISDKTITHEEMNIQGGLIAENKEKTVRIDYSFETLLEELQKDALPKIAKELLS
ncbi:hypothetical protein J4410_04995 [Candidatus Woesearchaeota archaeon]|nr:hypothetical protein [Candidatus Woesearchaeota archaeon]